MKETTLIIPGELPDLNQIIQASKTHWSNYSRMKKENTDLVSWIAKGKGKFEKIDIDILWHCKNKMKDKDNIMAGTKFILDGLVEIGLIRNDGWRHVGDINHKFRVDKKNPRIEVIIKECMEG